MIFHLQRCHIQCAFCCFDCCASVFCVQCTNCHVIFCSYVGITGCSCQHFRCYTPCRRYCFQRSCADIFQFCISVACEICLIRENQLLHSKRCTCVCIDTACVCSSQCHRFAARQLCMIFHLQRCHIQRTFCRFDFCVSVFHVQHVNCHVILSGYIGIASCGSQRSCCYTSCNGFCMQRTCCDFIQCCVSICRNRCVVFGR